ncbi:MAG: EAL domain-containing protein [Atopobiaceae bacterium]|nr:EAL domain-containing protein [Atopobiaceae bacterium]MBR3314255.1 EAL domain-containing protein [Atopobiaceae bacterium]
MAKRTDNLGTKSIILITVLLLVVITALALVLSHRSESALAEQIQDRMLDVANTSAALLDGDALARFTPQDQETPEYQRELSLLRSFQDSVELSYIYCVRERPDGTFEFTLDPTVADPADFGEQVHYTDALGRAANGEPAVDLIAYTDGWGTFYSAYSPVFGSDGKVASIVCVDYSANWYEKHTMQANVMIFFTCTAALTLALLAMVAVRKVSAREAQHIKSLRKAYLYDSLTGLPTMSHFFDLSKPARKSILSKGGDPTILYLDLVGMKFFNQRHGFSGGDDLLKAFANQLAKHFGTNCCSRFGQDYFVALTNSDDLNERLDAFIAECAQLNGGNNLPVRIGIYQNSMGDVGIGAACDNAKVANAACGFAYHSTYRYFSEEMLAQVQQRRYVIDNIDHAIAENWITVYYQPIIRASNGRVCDEEALARWVDPERGFLSPAEFIPALEDAKLIYKLDLHVLDQVLLKMRSLADAGLFVVPSSINLSRSDFDACDIVEEVRRRVDASGFDRSMINVEITETDIGRDFDFMKQQLEKFHALGFQVWMDDFGSEYSSLDYLQSLSFGLLKLDMRFMQQFDNGDRSKIILTELMKMAIGLGIDTITEGVERQDQVDFLREIGCNKLQGYFFDRPIPVETILERHESGTAIGFENPAESEYYSTIGRVNLYDLSSITRESEEDFQHYFDTIPMAIIEATDSSFTLLRCNKSYRAFIDRTFGGLFVGDSLDYAQAERNGGTRFLEVIQTCGKDSAWSTVEEITPDGQHVRSLIHQVATNPVTGTRALAVAVLSFVIRRVE